MLPGRFAAGHRLAGGGYLWVQVLLTRDSAVRLTLCLTNIGPADIALRRSERIVQMILHEVKNGCRRYDGRYQDSTGAVEAKET